MVFQYFEGLRRAGFHWKLILNLDKFFASLDLSLHGSTNGFGDKGQLPSCAVFKPGMSTIDPSLIACLEFFRRRWEAPKVARCEQERNFFAHDFHLTISEAKSLLIE